MTARVNGSMAIGKPSVRLMKGKHKIAGESIRNHCLRRHDGCGRQLLDEQRTTQPRIRAEVAAVPHRHLDIPSSGNQALSLRARRARGVHRAFTAWGLRHTTYRTKPQVYDLDWFAGYAVGVKLLMTPVEGRDVSLDVDCCVAMRRWRLDVDFGRLTYIPDIKTGLEYLRMRLDAFRLRSASARARKSERMVSSLLLSIWSAGRTTDAT